MNIIIFANNSISYDVCESKLKSFGRCFFYKEIDLNTFIADSTEHDILLFADMSSVAEMKAITDDFSVPSVIQKASWQETLAEVENAIKKEIELLEVLKESEKTEEPKSFKQKPIYIEQPVEKIVEQYIEVPVMVPVEVPQEKKRGLFRFRQGAEASTRLTHNFVRQTVQIGVFSLSRGAGATHTTVEIAEILANEGRKKVAAIAFDGKKEMQCLGKSKVDYYIPRTVTERFDCLGGILQCSYDYIIIDFGYLFKVNPSGELEFGELAENKQIINELYRCNYKVGVGFSDPWHFDILQYYESNAAFSGTDTTFAIVGGDGNIGREYELNIIERDTNLIIEKNGWL